MATAIDPISSGAISPTGQALIPSQANPIGTAQAFGQVLDEAINRGADLRFSAHAQRRLQSRDIELGNEDLSKIQKAVDKAEEKGSKESLVLLDNVALVVSVENRTVITALNVPDIRDNIVTNIDSVVIA
jgi:flagellar operon protein